MIWADKKREIRSQQERESSSFPVGFNLNHPSLLPNIKYVRAAERNANIHTLHLKSRPQGLIISVRFNHIFINMKYLCWRPQRENINAFIIYLMSCLYFDAVFDQRASSLHHLQLLAAVFIITCEVLNRCRSSVLKKGLKF